MSFFQALTYGAFSSFGARSFVQGQIYCILCWKCTGETTKLHHHQVAEKRRFDTDFFQSGFRGLCFMDGSNPFGF